jgi:predicted enzyme related to lactoylglutathione lyase
MARPIHFELPADDPARAIAFYAEALGWEIVLPGSILGIIVGYATQRYGRTPRPRTA